jgi:gas vesicle protein
MSEQRQVRTTDARLEAAKSSDSSFLKGLVGGAVIGAVAGVLMAPQFHAALRQLRRELTDATADARHGAAEKYHEATARVGDAVDDLQEKGRDVYGKALNVVIRGADDVKARATDAQIELDKRAAHSARS